MRTAITSLEELKEACDHCVGPNPLILDFGNLTSLEVLSLEYEGIEGSIPEAIGQLQNLTKLDLSYNKLTGTLPSALGELSKLRILKLSGNQLDGNLGSMLEKLTQLEVLSLEVNRFTGAFAPGPMTALKTLDISMNRFSGGLSNGFDQLILLTQLRADVNLLSGELQLEKLTKLTELTVRDNRFTGGIPTTIGRLSELVRLDVSNNNFHETSIPTELGNLGNLMLFVCWGAGLTGRLPSEIGRLSKLTWIVLDTNALTGPLPSEVGKLTALGGSYLFSNKFAGKIPSSIQNLVSLSWLRLDSNELTGPIDTNVLERLSRLEGLGLARNKLEGTIPSSLYSLSNIGWLRLDGNRLSGPGVSTQIQKLSKLTWLSLSDNRLSSSLPTQIGQLSLLDGLDLSANNFSGTLPTEIAGLANVIQLDLSMNEFSAMLPTSIGRLDLLWEFRAFSNQFTGPLPDSLARLTGLHLLDLCNNSFSALPSSIGDLRALTELAVCRNKLTVCPAGLRRLSDLRKLDLSHNPWTSISSDVWRISTLTELSLDNSIQSGTVPTLIRALTSLQILSLRTNELSGLPADLWRLSSLQALDLSNNALKVLHEDIGKLGNLRVLNVSKNGLTSVPSALGQLRLLSVLDFHSNALTVLPSHFGQLRLLESIDLSNNELSLLPSEVGVLVFLTSIRTGNNPWVCDCGAWKWFDFMGSLADNDETFCGEQREPLATKLHFAPSQPCEAPRLLQAVNVTPWEIDLSFSFREQPNYDQHHIKYGGCWECSASALPLSPNKVEQPTLAFRSELRTQEGDLLYRCCWSDRSRFTGLYPHTVATFRTQAVFVVWTMPNAGQFAAELQFGPWSESITIKSLPWLPSRPENVIVSSIGINSVHLQWNAPSTPNGELTLCEVRLKHGTDIVLQVLGDGQKRSAKITSLEEGRDYEIAVRAATRAGRGEWSDTVSTRTEDRCLRAGWELDAGTRRCRRCPVGRYRSLREPRCERCPEDFPLTRNDGATSEASCITTKGYFAEYGENTKSMVARSCTDNGLSSRIECSVPGLSLETITVRPGYWRIGNQSVDVRKCEPSEYCVGGNGSNYCAAGFRGILCSLCEEGLSLDSDRRICTTCDPDKIMRDGTIGIMLILAWIVLVISPTIILWCGLRSRSKRRRSKAKLSCDSFSSMDLQTELFMILGYYQVTFAALETAAQLPGISAVRALFDLDLARIAFNVSVGCFTEISYYASLLLYTLSPIASVLLMGLFVAYVALSRDRKTLQIVQTRLIWLVSLMIVVLYPGVSNAVVQAFVSEEFPHFPGDPTPYRGVIADPNVDYDSTTSAFFRAFAVIMVLVYPVGGALYFATVGLMVARENAKALSSKIGKASDDSNALGRRNVTEQRRSGQLNISKALSFLGRYRAGMEWYEAFELGRKFILTSLFLLFFQAFPDLALVVFALLNVCFLVAVQKLNPYRRMTSQLLAEALAWLLTLLAFTFLIQGTHSFLLGFTLLILILPVVLSLLVVVLRRRTIQEKGVTDDEEPDMQGAMMFAEQSCSRT